MLNCLKIADPDRREIDRKTFEKQLQLNFVSYLIQKQNISFQPSTTFLVASPTSELNNVS